MLKQFLLSSFLIAFSLVCTHAQSGLYECLADKTSFSEISRSGDAYYDNLAANNLQRPAGDPKRKHWERWKWYVSGRLGPNGEFVNIPKRILQAKQDLDRRTYHPSSGRSTVSNWSFIGPAKSEYFNTFAEFNGLGRVDRIAFHPTNSNVIYVGAPAGGLWRTSNDGASWTALSDYIPSMGVSGIVISHANPNIIYVLTGDGDSKITNGLVNGAGYVRNSVGVLKSLDGGLSWSQTGELATGEYVGYRLVQDPNNAATLLAATDVGLFKTTNGGNSWTEVNAGKHYDVEYKPGSSSIAYATKSGRAYSSNNGGDSWTEASFGGGGICCSGRVEIAVTPAGSNLVYLVAGPVFDTLTFNGLWLSNDSGQSYTLVRNSPNILGSASDGNSSGDQSDYDLCIAASPENQNTVLTGALTVWRSTTAGLLMTNATTYRETGDPDTYIHPDVHDLAYNPLNGHVYAATDGGFYKSTDDGLTWTDLTEGIATAQCYHMASIGNLVMLGSQDNGVKKRQSTSTSYDHVFGADGFDVVYDYGNTSISYATINASTMRFTSNGLSRSNITIPGQAFFSNLAMHPSDPTIIYLGSSDVYRSTDSGTNWANRGADGRWAMATCPSNGNRIYAAGGGSMWRSDDQGGNWTELKNKPGFPATFSKITDIEVNPTSSSEVWITLGGFDPGSKVYRSINAGESWTNISGTLPDIPMNCLSVVSLGKAYVGSDLGVFFINLNSMTDWIPFSNNLPPIPVTEIRLAGGKMRAATFGRGIWEADPAQTCSTAQTITSNLEGDQFFNTSFSIVSTSDVTGGVGTDVVFKAGNYVQMNVGFHARIGNEFEAKIGGCGGGVPD